MKKTILSTALFAAMGVAGTAQAVNVTNLSIEDWDGAAGGQVSADDVALNEAHFAAGTNIAGGFAFASGASDPSKFNRFFDDTASVSSSYSTVTTDGTGIDVNGTEQSSATPGADDSFTAGFVFNGYGFKPNSLDATGVGTTFNAGQGGIQTNAVNDLDTSLSFSEFTWSGIFGTNMFPLSPESAPGVKDPTNFSTNVLTQGGACSEAVGGNTACYILRWEHFIQPQGGFSGDTVWQLEGIATFDGNVNLVPVPAAAWLFGSGLLGLVGVARRRRNA